MGDFDFGLTEAKNYIKEKGAEFTARYNRFIANLEWAKSNSPALYNKYISVKSQAQKIRDVIASVFSGVDSGLGAITRLPANFRAEMGAAPLVIGAGVVAAAGALAYIGGKMVDGNTEIEKYRYLKESGASPQVIADTIKAQGASNSPDFSGIIKWSIIGVGAYLVYKNVIASRKNGN